MDGSMKPSPWWGRRSHATESNGAGREARLGQRISGEVKNQETSIAVNILT